MREGLLLARGILARIPRFSVSNFICEYAAYFDSGEIAAMPIEGDKRYVWDVRPRGNGDITVGDWNKRRRHSGRRGTYTCPCVFPGVDIPFVLCFKDVGYEKALRQLFAA